MADKLLSLSEDELTPSSRSVRHNYTSAEKREHPRFAELPLSLSDPFHVRPTSSFSPHLDVKFEVIGSNKTVSTVDSMISKRQSQQVHAITPLRRVTVQSTNKSIEAKQTVSQRQQSSKLKLPQQ